MRIIAGSLGGRIFASPRGHVTHPMADRVRGGLFNALGDISGLTVLDAFAGSGALSFEAISRGAAHATAIDEDKEAYRTIVANIAALGLDEQVTAIRRRAGSWASGHPDAFFDLVFCDPPYQDLRRDLLLKVASRLQPDGTYVLSWPGHEPAPRFKGMEVVRQKAYGDAQLIFYQRTK
ncbi:MAG TPA: 16S rRNA (guanine(966)-N(2))-methyltransferase RsmD [Candidatus Saccharimonadales bacterium]|nr:16S rRNA (guanine(966)-N(2))-methyltransferase RsmD [Candidatus Saccharimonadales bacterium]